jgi:hypothetical protein
MTARFCPRVARVNKVALEQHVLLHHQINAFSRQKVATEPAAYRDLLRMLSANLR